MSCVAFKREFPLQHKNEKQFSIVTVWWRLGRAGRTNNDCRCNPARRFLYSQVARFKTGEVRFLLSPCCRVGLVIHEFLPIEETFLIHIVPIRQAAFMFVKSP